MKLLSIFILFSLSAFGQAKTGGLTANGIIDFSGSATSTPEKTDTALPATCAVLQIFGRTSDNTMWYCSATNTWTQFGTSTLVTPVAVVDGGTGLTTAFARTAFITAALCNNASASAAYDLPTANAPAPVCGGTSYRFGALAYDDAADETASFYFPLPTGWTGDIDFTGYAFVNATSQSVKLTVATVCIATSTDILNPTFNAAQTITVTSPGTANQLFTFAQAAMTVTGCSAGNTLVVKVGRDTTDTSTATFNFTGSQLVIRVTPQA